MLRDDSCAVLCCAVLCSCAVMLRDDSCAAVLCCAVLCCAVMIAVLCSIAFTSSIVVFFTACLNAYTIIIFYLCD